MEMAIKDGATEALRLLRRFIAVVSRICIRMR